MNSTFMEVRWWSLFCLLGLVSLGNYCHLLRIRDLEHQNAEQLRRVELLELQAMIHRQPTKGQ